MHNILDSNDEYKWTKSNNTDRISLNHRSKYHQSVEGPYFITEYPDEDTTIIINDKEYTLKIKDLLKSKFLKALLKRREKIVILEFDGIKVPDYFIDIFFKSMFNKYWTNEYISLEEYRIYNKMVDYFMFDGMETYIQKIFGIDRILLNKDYLIPVSGKTFELSKEEIYDYLSYNIVDGGEDSYDLWNYICMDDINIDLIFPGFIYRENEILDILDDNYVINDKHVGEINKQYLKDYMGCRLKGNVIFYLLYGVECDSICIHNYSLINYDIYAPNSTYNKNIIEVGRFGSINYDTGGFEYDLHERQLEGDIESIVYKTLKLDQFGVDKDIMEYKHIFERYLNSGFTLYNDDSKITIENLTDTLAEISNNYEEYSKSIQYPKEWNLE